MMSDQNRDDARSRRRRQRRGYALLILAAGMLAFGVAAGTLYYVLRPTTLRIAVGPAGSDAERQHAGGKDQERIAPPLSPAAGSRIIVVRV